MASDRTNLHEFLQSHDLLHIERAVILGVLKALPGKPGLLDRLICMSDDAILKKCGEAGIMPPVAAQLVAAVQAGRPAAAASHPTPDAAATGSTPTDGVCRLSGEALQKACDDLRRNVPSSGSVTAEAQPVVLAALERLRSHCMAKASDGTFPRMDLFTVNLVCHRILGVGQASAVELAAARFLRAAANDPTAAREATSAFRPLLHLLSSDCSLVVAAAAGALCALGHMGGDMDASFVRPRRELDAIGALVHLLTPTAAEEPAAGAGDEPRSRTVEYAAGALASYAEVRSLREPLCDAGAGPALAALLGSPRPTEVEAAARAFANMLANWDEPRGGSSDQVLARKVVASAAPQLLQLLQSPHEGISYWAIAALQRLLCTSMNGSVSCSRIGLDALARSGGEPARVLAELLTTALPAADDDSDPSSRVLMLVYALTGLCGRATLVREVVAAGGLVAAIRLSRRHRELGRAGSNLVNYITRAQAYQWVTEVEGVRVHRRPLEATVAEVEERLSEMAAAAKAEEQRRREADEAHRRMLEGFAERRREQEQAARRGGEPGPSADQRGDELPPAQAPDGGASAGDEAADENGVAAGDEAAEQPTTNAPSASWCIVM